MDGPIVLGVLAALWVLIGPAVALVSALRANRRADDLQRRIFALEAQARVRPPPTSAPEARPSYGEAFGPQAEPAATAPSEPVPGPWDVAAAQNSASEPEPPEPPIAEPEAIPELTPAAPPPPRESLESKIGARWSVLVGGLALALGAVFLVRYSIEAGLLGPAARIALGFLLAAILFAAGEWLRRRDWKLELPMPAGADVPAILTGAGGIALFATIYAAYALYGFLGPAAAFVLLTVAGLVTLFLSAVHGPGLAALGALGSYAAPLLVSSAAPAPFAVVFHTLAVTAAVLGIARVRGWAWLAIGGLAGSLGWGLLLLAIPTNQATGHLLLMVAGLAVLYVGAFLYGAQPTTLRDRRPEPLALAALAGIALLSLAYGYAQPAYPVLASGILVTAALGATAARWPSAAPAALLAALVAVATVTLVRVAAPVDFGTMQIGVFEWAILGEEGLGRSAANAALIALLIGLASFLSADRAAASAPLTSGYFAAAGAGAPLLILVVVYLRHTPFETRPVVGVAALVLAALYAAMAERLVARRPDDDVAPGPALYAAGAVLALSFAAAVGLATRFIPLSLSLGAAGTVWVGLKRPVRLLPALAVLVAALACAAVALGPPFTPEELGTRPILNGLILRLGVPALAVLFAAEMQRRHRDGIESALLQTIGLVLAALFVALEIRHAAGGGIISSGPTGIGEQGALTLAMLAFALGLQRIARTTRSKVYETGSLVAGVLGAASIALAHFVTANPLLTGQDVGAGHVVNLLLPGYLLPAVGAAWVAFEARPVRPRWYVLIMAALSLLLAFAYLTLTVRHVFHGGMLAIGAVGDAENWTYSAVWLVFGILLLTAGMALRSAMVRAASGLVIALVVSKVFLFDMAALTGALRAASFIGLGLVLIGIGRLYQRLLLGARPP